MRFSLIFSFAVSGILVLHVSSVYAEGGRCSGYVRSSRQDIIDALAKAVAPPVANGGRELIYLTIPSLIIAITDAHISADELFRPLSAREVTGLDERFDAISPGSAAGSRIARTLRDGWSTAVGVAALQIAKLVEITNPGVLTKHEWDNLTRTVVDGVGTKQIPTLREAPPHFDEILSIARGKSGDGLAKAVLDSLRGSVAADELRRLGLFESFSAWDANSSVEDSRIAYALRLQRDLKARGKWVDPKQLDGLIRFICYLF